MQRPDSGQDSVSEAQAYGLLRAVWSGDQAAFDRCYEWTEAHLSQNKLKGSHLLAWHWGRDDQGRWGVLDANSASDADLDYAAALLLAHRRWGRPVTAASRLSVSGQARSGGHPGPGNLPGRPGPPLAAAGGLAGMPAPPPAQSFLLFSRLVPAFFEKTQDRRWLELSQSAYTGMDLVSRRLGNNPGIGLVPDWCLLIDPRARRTRARAQPRLRLGRHPPALAGGVGGNMVPGPPQ